MCWTRSGKRKCGAISKLKIRRILVEAGQTLYPRGQQADIYMTAAFEPETVGVTYGTENKHENVGAFLEKRTEKHFWDK